MQRKAFISLIVPIVFGIPFLLFTDFFPFHRYGMFSRIPKEKPAPNVRILLASADTLLELKTGSACLDRGLPSEMARKAFVDSVIGNLLVQKLRASLNPFPDSVFVEQKTFKGWNRKIIFP